MFGGSTRRRTEKRWISAESGFRQIWPLFCCPIIPPLPPLTERLEAEGVNVSPVSGLSRKQHLIFFWLLTDSRVTTPAPRRQQRWLLLKHKHEIIKKNRKGSLCVPWETAHWAFLYLSEDPTRSLTPPPALLRSPSVPGERPDFSRDTTPYPQHTHLFSFCLPLSAALSHNSLSTRPQGNTWIWRRLPRKRMIHSHTHKLTLSPFTHLFIYGYLDWRLQALPSSTLAPLLSDALRKTARVPNYTKLFSPASHCVQTERKKKKKNSHKVELHVTGMSIACEVWKQEPAFFFLWLNQHLTQHKRSVRQKQAHQSVFLLTMADLPLEPAVLSTVQRHVHTYSTERTSTGGLVLHIFCSDAHREPAGGRLPHSTVCTLHTEVSVWAGHWQDIAKPGWWFISIAKAWAL